MATSATRSPSTASLPQHSKEDLETADVLKLLNTAASDAKLALGAMQSVSNDVPPYPSSTTSEPHPYPTSSTSHGLSFPPPIEAPAPQSAPSADSPTSATSSHNALQAAATAA